MRENYVDVVLVVFLELGGGIKDEKKQSLVERKLTSGDYKLLQYE